MKRLNTQFVRQFRFITLSIGAACLLFCAPVQAVTYTWINPAGGNWSTGANWAGGTAPVSASGGTADFSHVGLTANVTVNVDTAVTIGNLLIGNTNTTSPSNWIFTDNGNTANILTLAGGTSSITITNMGAGTNLVDFSTLSVGGTGGLTVNGGGALEMDVTNFYTGGTTVAGGTLILGAGVAAGENDTDTYTMGSSAATAPSILRVNKSGSHFNNPVACASGAAGPVLIGNYSAQSVNIYGTITLNGNNLTLTNGADDTTFAFLVNGAITGTGNVACFNNSSSAGFTCANINNAGGVSLAGTTTATTSFSMTYGSAVTGVNYLGPCALPAFTAPENTNGVTIASSATINTKSISVPLSLSNLTMNCNSSGNLLFGTWDWRAGGKVINAGTGTGMTTISAGIFNDSGITAMIQNSATSPLVLSGKNYYNVPTLVSNGWLVWNCGYTAIQAGSPITVQSGGTLSGTGWIPNVLTVKSGGTLAPGTNDGLTLGTLILTNNGSQLKGGLSLNGNLFFKLHKGLAQSNDIVLMAGSVNALTNLGTGTLFVTNVGPALAPGDTFYLFSAPVLGGSNLTIVCTGNTFSNQLSLNGSISVAASLPSPPVITRLSPTNGYTAGGTSVTITGTGFAGGDTVTFDTSAGTGITVTSSTNLNVTTPAHAVGLVNVKVTDTNGQSSTLNNAFAYKLPAAPVITHLSPTNGYTTGGTSVTVTGTNFASGDTVTFGGVAGTGVTVNNVTNLTVTTPAGSAGAVNVTVTDTGSQSSTLTNGFTYVAPSSGAPAIVITNIPAFGTYGTNCFLSGYVANANTATNCLMICDYWPNENPSPSYDAKLTPWGWFSRPTFSNYLTPIQPDGSWKCNMPSNFDQYATEYAVMLVPTNFSNPFVNAAAALPLADINLSEAIVYATRVNTNRRAITWSGYNWWVKTAGSDGNEFLGVTGPGGNHYADATNNVRVDAQGLLHLQITHPKAWECVQIWNDQSLGYGQYSCTLNASISNLDANVIFSMFTWSDDNDYVNREIDMEVSRWGYAFGSNNVEDFAISPYHTGQTIRFPLPANVTNSTHSFTWLSTNQVQFETYNGNYSASPDATNILETSTITAQPIPPAGGENISLILWLYQGDAPVSGQPVEVTLSDFEFTPSGTSPRGEASNQNPKVTAPPATPGQPTGLVNPAGKAVTVYFSGTPGSSYNVERSTNMLNGWKIVGTGTASDSGVFNYTDTFDDLDGVPPTSAYYRLSW